MNKTKAALIALPLIAAIGLGAYYFVSRSQTAYLNALPSDLKALARFDLLTFADEADLEISDFVDFVRHARSSEKSETGIDFSRPLYAFAAESGNFGMVAAIADDDDFTALCEELHAEGRASAIARQRGYSWVTLLDRWLCAFDGSRALVMGPVASSAQDQLRVEMVRLLEQNKDYSGQTTLFFSQLAKKSGAAVAMIGPELFPPRLRLFFYKLRIASHNDGMVSLQLSTRANELFLDAVLEPLTDETKSEVTQMFDKLRPIKGELIGNAHSDNSCWLGLNIEGSRLLKFMRTSKSLRSALAAMNLAIDLDNIISAIDGDVAFEFTPDFSPSPHNLVSFNFHGFYLAARLRDTSCFDGAAAWGNSFVDVQSLGPLDYSLSLASERYYLGAADNILYLGSQQGLTTEGNSLLQAQQATIAGSRFYATFSMPQLVKLAVGLTTVPSPLRKFERVTLSVDSDNAAHLRLSAPSGIHIAKELLNNE